MTIQTNRTLPSSTGIPSAAVNPGSSGKPTPTGGGHAVASGALGGQNLEVTKKASDAYSPMGIGKDTIKEDPDLEQAEDQYAERLEEQERQREEAKAKEQGTYQKKMSNIGNPPLGTLC